MTIDDFRSIGRRAENLKGGNKGVPMYAGFPTQEGWIEHIIKHCFALPMPRLCFVCGG
jgi:hypothetical protein